MLGVLEIEYNCCEQFMMATKAAIMKDMDTRHLIMATSDPRKQKALGRAVKNYDDKLWDKHKLGVVYLGNYIKATSSKFLKSYHWHMIVTSRTLEEVLQLMDDNYQEFLGEGQ